MKKIITYALLLCLLVSMFAVSVSAADRVFDDSTNLALNAEYDVSSENVGSVDNWGEAALNGEVSQTTRWGNWYSDEGGPGNTWFMIDFGKSTTFNRMTVVESANPALYDNGKCEEWKVEVSNDKKEWTEVATGNWLTKGPNTVYNDISPNLGDPYDIDFATVDARYVRLSITKVERAIEGGGPEDLSNNLSISIIAVFNEAVSAPAPQAEVAVQAEAEVAVETPPVESAEISEPVAPSTFDAITLIAIAMFVSAAGAVAAKKRKI